MKRYIELEIDIYRFQEEDIIKTSPSGGDESSSIGGEPDELPFVPFG